MDVVWHYNCDSRKDDAIGAIVFKRQKELNGCVARDKRRGIRRLNGRAACPQAAAIGGGIRRVEDNAPYQVGGGGNGDAVVLSVGANRYEIWRAYGEL